VRNCLLHQTKYFLVRMTFLLVGGKGHEFVCQRVALLLMVKECIARSCTMLLGIYIVSCPLGSTGVVQIVVW
jgi:hypothetical protein